MKVGIDCRLAGSTHAGIGRYVENLITRLPQKRHDQSYVFFFHDEIQKNAIFPKDIPGTIIQYCPIKHYSLKEQFVMPMYYEKHKLDLLHVPHFNVPIMYQKKFVVTIHDLLWHQQKGLEVTTLKKWQYWPKYCAYRSVTRSAILRAAHIFVPAYVIKKTIIQYYPQAEQKITVTKEGSEHIMCSDGDKSILKKIDVTKKTLLYVGSLYPHKNVKLIINALSSLSEYQLLVVGSRNSFQNKMKKYIESRQNLQQRVVFLGYIPDNQLQTLISYSNALVQPSLSEGFGLTGIEAMALGSPVLASDIPIFREIYQNGVTFFNPRSTKSFIAAVKKLENTTYLKTLKKTAQQVVKKYSWDTMVSQTQNMYQKVLERSP